MRPENAPDINDPEYMKAVRKASSLRVYQLERKNRTPGLKMLVKNRMSDLSTYEISGLDETQDKSAGNEATKTLDATSRTRNNTPDYHHTW